MLARASAVPPYAAAVCLLPLLLCWQAAFEIGRVCCTGLLLQGCCICSRLVHRRRLAVWGGTSVASWPYLCRRAECVLVQWLDMLGSLGPLAPGQPTASPPFSRRAVVQKAASLGLGSCSCMLCGVRPLCHCCIAKLCVACATWLLAKHTLRRVHQLQQRGVCQACQPCMYHTTHAPSISGQSRVCRRAPARQP